VNYGYLKTPIGIIEIINDNKLLQVNLVNEIKCENENELTKEVKKQLNEYFDKKRTTFNLPIKLTGTPFQISVWKALENIPYGRTCSYQDIANKINSKAIQAVGTAIGKNHILIIIPCHRVINKNGNIGGFALDIDIKKNLLHIEQ